MCVCVSVCVRASMCSSVLGQVFTLGLVGALVAHDLALLHGGVLGEGLGQGVIVHLVAHVPHKDAEVPLVPFHQAGIPPALLSRPQMLILTLAYKSASLLPGWLC